MVPIPTSDKGLHCKGRACIFLHWSTLLPRGREQATDPRAVAVVSLGPSPHHPPPPTHTHPHTNTGFSTTKADMWDLLHWAMSENATLQTIPTVAVCHYPESICPDNPHMGHSDVFRSIYMTKLKSVKPPEIPGMGVSVDRKMKGERKK